jgi:hypothetical protein
MLIEKEVCHAAPRSELVAKVKGPVENMAVAASLRRIKKQNIQGAILYE